MCVKRKVSTPASPPEYAVRAIASAKPPTVRPSSDLRRADSSGAAPLRAGSPRRTVAMTMPVDAGRHAAMRWRAEGERVQHATESRSGVARHSRVRAIELRTACSSVNISVADPDGTHCHAFQVVEVPIRVGLRSGSRT
jgi:hypothetical protein